MGREEVVVSVSKCVRVWCQDKHPIHCEAKEFIQISVMVKKQIIGTHWRNPGEPSFQEWLTGKKVASYEQMSLRVGRRNMWQSGKTTWNPL